MRRFGDIPGKHFAASTRRVPASWSEAQNRLRLGLADYLAFVSEALHVHTLLDVARLLFEIAGALSLLGLI